MTDPASQDDSDLSTRIGRDGGIQRKLFRSHLTLGLLGLLLLSVALLAILRLARTNDQLAVVDGPTVRQSTLALVGIERSKSDLRGWIVLGEDRFRRQRREAWQTTIFPAVSKLHEFSERWTSSENKVRLAEIETLLGDLQEAQWWVEDVAQVAGNYPAKDRYERDIGPIIRRLQRSVTRLVEELKTSQDYALATMSLGYMADARYNLTRGNTALMAFVTSGEPVDEERFSASLAASRRAIAAIRAQPDALTNAGRELLDSTFSLLSAYELLSAEVIRRRQLPNWDRAASLLSRRVVPLSDSLSELLSELAFSQSNRMDEHARQAANLTRGLTAVLLVLMVAMAIAAYWLSLRSAQALTNPIQALVAATQEMAAGRDARDIPVQSRDEVGQLTHSFNQMRASLENTTQQMNFAYQRLTSLVESAVDGIITIDEKGTMESVNEAAVGIFGYTREEMIGQNVKMLMPSPDREAHDEYLANYLRTGKATIIGRGRDVIATRKNGVLFPVHLSISEALADGRRFFTGILYDLTEQKKLEQALERSRYELEQRAAELQRSNDDLQQFAYVASHDLQEPLRAVAGFTQLLQQDYGNELDDTAREYIRHAVDGATRMQTLIRNLLEYSRVQSHGNPFEPVDCSQQLARALDALAVRMQDAGATVDAGPLPKIMGDPTQIQQLLQNLVGNAIKFHGDDPPHVRIRADEFADKWQFSVADNGIGIDDGHLERIFVIFQRLHSRSKYDGTGIGLAICQRILQRHGGTIWAESVAGQGSTFCFTIPKDMKPQGRDEYGQTS